MKILARVCWGWLQAQAEAAPAVGGSGTVVLVRMAAQGKLRAQRGLSAGAAQRWCERSGMEMREGSLFINQFG